MTYIRLSYYNRQDQLEVLQMVYKAILELQRY